jgi:hypothetical protein
MTTRTHGLSLSAAAALSALLLLAPGCQRETPAVGRIEVQPRAVSLPSPQLAILHLTWTPAAAGGNAAEISQPLVFMHLLDAKGQVLRTFDHPFPQRWVEGSPVSYDVKLVQSAIAPPLAPGTYRLGVGLYDPSGKRWPLDGLDKPIGRQEYLAAEVEVPSVPAVPRFAFSGSWLPVEAGSDKQVVARRWLSDQPGEIRIDAVPGPGTLWFSFRIPPGDGSGDKLVPHDASNSLAAVIRSTCGAVETGISGPGPHDVEIPIQGPGPDGSCRVSLVANFHVVFAARPEPRSVSLEGAAWIPAGANGAAPQAEPTPAPAPAPRPPAGSGH